MKMPAAPMVVSPALVPSGNVTPRLLQNVVKESTLSTTSVALSVIFKYIFGKIIAKVMTIQ